MAISVKDIQEKEFSIVSGDGYDMGEVDDFLDAVADQMGELSTRCRTLESQVQELKDALAAAETANAEAELKAPEYNDSAYFKRLESIIRETQLSAQRIADEAVAEAKRTAQQTIDDANAQAEKTVAEAEAHAESITGDAKQSVTDLTAEVERLRGMIDTYKTNFRKLVDEQFAALNSSEA